MKKSVVSVLSVVLAFSLRADSDHGSYFSDEENLVIDCGGKSREVESWGQSKWNGQELRVKNGKLTFTKNVHCHGGDIDVESGATLAFGSGCRLGTGLGDAGTRVFRIASGGALEMKRVSWNMDHTRVEISVGASWYADLDRLEFLGGQKDNLWDIAGKAVFPNGISCAKDDWGCELKIVLREGGELLLGGPVSFGGKNGKIELLLEGGVVTLVRDADFAPGIVRLAPGAKVEFRVAGDASFDEKSVEVPADAKITVVKGVKEPAGLPTRYQLSAETDRAGRSYWIDAVKYTNIISKIRYHHPNPDSASKTKFEMVVTTNRMFRCRFPEGEGPWTIDVEITTKSGRAYNQKVTVTRSEKKMAKPTPNEQILVGITGYGNSIDLTSEMITNDLCNLYVGWHSANKTLGEKLPEHLRPLWKKTVDERKLWSMSIYAGDNAQCQANLSDFFGGRYLGNNCGELASFMYQGRNECGILMNGTLADAKHDFVNQFCGSAAFGWMSKFPFMFSTCGAALSCYELQGGIDYICNEVWAIGAQNVAHTSAEARGAARKWGPEYWAAWNAHEWQTTGVPYLTQQKFDSCFVGFVEEYIAGTSMMVQESGTQQTQAWQYTSRNPGEDKDKRIKEEYDGEVPRRYREVTKRFWDFVKAHPREKGTPESKIAMALGNLDAYLGQNGGFTVWSQHDRAAADHKRWKYGAPENTQSAMEDVFFPRPQDALKPFGNRWVGGTPYGQADVMQIDDESRVSDLARYDLLVFGGWNTMTPHVKDVLERYVQTGGTVVLARVHLFIGFDRDEESDDGKDLLPLFGWLPEADGRFAEKTFGRGKVVLWTGKGYPGADKKILEVYAAKVRELAGAVKQSATLAGEQSDLANICYGVYGKTVYLLNADTVAPHSFTLVTGKKRTEITLGPCEFRTEKIR